MHTGHSPENASFRQFGSAPGMVGRTNPSPAWEPPECHVGMSGQKEGAGRKEGGEVSLRLPRELVVSG